MKIKSVTVGNYKNVPKTTIEFERIVSNCELYRLDPALTIEIKNILREMYIDLIFIMTHLY